MRSIHKIVLGVSVIFQLTSISNAQERIRMVFKSDAYPNQPIEVVSREVGNQPFIDSMRVMAGPDWIKELSFGVKNISDKAITAFDLNIVIKQEGPMLAAIAFPIFFRTYTKVTENNARTPVGEVKLGVLQPGEIVKLKISDNDFIWADNILKKWGVQDISRATFEIRGVYFEDGTRWMFGQESRPDPNNPDKRVPIRPQ